MFPPNIDPQVYALSAVLVGAALSPELTANEANTIGNWLVLVGDYLLAYAGQITLIKGRQNISNDQNHKAEMDSILNALRKMECELEQIKRGYHS